MDNLAVAKNNNELFQGISENLFNRFVSFIDARPKTVETYKRALRQFFRFLLLRGIKYPVREDLVAFREELRISHKPCTIQLYIVALRQFFKWTAQEKLFPDIAASIKGAKIEREHKKDWLNSRQARDLLSSIDKSIPLGVRDFAIISLMLTTGLRTIEVARANLEDLRPLGESTVLYIQGKGRDEKTEYIKISGPVEQAIREYLRIGGPLDSGEALFRSFSNQNRQGRLSQRSISGIVKNRLKAAGYYSDRLSAHSLRHTAVTLALLNGEKLEDVQRFARHASVNSTLIYAHNIDMLNNSCANSVSDSIFNQG